MRVYEIGCVLLLLALSLSGCLQEEDPPRPLIDEESISGLPSPVHNATVIDIPAREVRQVTSQPISDPRFAPDGDFVFLSSGEPPQIERLHRGTGDIEQLARGYSPTIEGDQLYWVSSTSADSQIRAKSLDGTNETHTVYEPPRGCLLGHERGLDINGPGTHLAFVEDCENTPGGETSKVELLDLRNGTTRVVSVGNHPRFESPTTLLHDRETDGGDREILRQNLTTGRERILVPAHAPGTPSHPVPGPGDVFFYSVFEQRETAPGGDVHEIRFHGSWDRATGDSGPVLRLGHFAIGVVDTDAAGNEIVLDVLRQDTTST